MNTIHSYLEKGVYLIGDRNNFDETKFHTICSYSCFVDEFIDVVDVKEDTSMMVLIRSGFLSICIPIFVNDFLPDSCHKIVLNEPNNVIVTFYKKNKTVIHFVESYIQLIFEDF